MVNLNKLYTSLLRNSWGELLGAQLPHDLAKLSAAGTNLKNLINILNLQVSPLLSSLKKLISLLKDPNTVIETVLHNIGPVDRASLCKVAAALLIAGAGVMSVMSLAMIALYNSRKLIQSSLNSIPCEALASIFFVGTLYKLPTLIENLPLSKESQTLALYASTILMLGSPPALSSQRLLQLICTAQFITSSLGLIASAGALYKMPEIVCNSPIPEAITPTTSLYIGTAAAAISSIFCAVQLLTCGNHR